jgi:hypothetical protein
VGSYEEDDNKKKWDVLRNIFLALNQHGMHNSELAHAKQDKSYCI